MSSTHLIPESSAPFEARSVGVLGGGQLGRMLALAGYPLGVHCKFVDPTPNSPAGAVAPQIAADYVAREAIRELAACEVVTYEFESVPVEAAHELAETTPVFPPPNALATAQDRLSEKECFRALGVPTAPFAPVSTEAELRDAVARLGLPAVLKTRRLGYDGKGQCVLRSMSDVEPAFRSLGGVPLLLEGFVKFERELSLLAVRGRDGSIAFYPLVENHHRDGILRVTWAPAPNLDAALQNEAEEHVRKVLERLDYVGVLAVEFFACEGRLFANEMAPRVHNSGHFSIEGARTSQFENHLRAVLGLPLGSTEVPEPCAMLNLVGELPTREAVLAVPGAHLHLYDKTPRTGRKVGHITVRAADRTELTRRVEALLRLPGAG
ncbi:MAG TPA: 5-(carboxyamino)imidazole ribonucleotide synthase [Polyangiaceae bacterium]|nr:5-(carboxyamino)imidazole ribonucleotide synthase [Polyangiaceae bacterium]